MHRNEGDVAVRDVAVGGATRSERRGSVWRVVLLASVIAMFLATSSAPTPLYATYSASWGLTDATTALVFGTYAISLLLALLTVGELSDFVGRQRVLLGALAVQILAMAVFMVAGGLGTLLCARVLQGLSTGAGVTAVGAAMMDVDASRGASANSISPPAGSAIGALGAAVLVQLAPAPTRTVYAVFGAVLLVQAVTLAVLGSPSTRTAGRQGVMRSLIPHVQLPRSARGEFLAAAPVLFAIWALSGFFGSLGPHLVHDLAGSESPIYGALPLAIIGAVSPVVGFATRHQAPAHALRLGIGGLILGVAIAVSAVVSGIAALLIISAAVAGAGFGSGFRGGMELVLTHVDPEERSGALAALYTVSYIGFGVPAILAGLVVVQTGHLEATTVGYAAVLLVLAVIALLVLRALNTRGSAETTQGAIS